MKDKDYNLVSTLYHALQGLETCGAYGKDAEEAGDSDVVKFLQDAQDQYRQIAEQAKDLLRNRLA
jgi:hypothetical protein